MCEIHGFRGCGIFTGTLLGNHTIVLQNTKKIFSELLGLKYRDVLLKRLHDYSLAELIQTSLPVQEVY